MIKLINLLKEVGEATSQIYPWKISSTEGETIYYTFQTNSDLDYKVSISYFEYDDYGTYIPAIDVAFAVKTDKEFSTSALTNKGELYSIMATVVDIIKNYISKNSNIKIIIYTPEKKDKNFGKQRNKLYSAFVKNQIPGATIEEFYDDVIIRIP